MKRTPLFIVVFFAFACAVHAQRLAVVQPAAADGAVVGFAEALTVELSKRSKLIDKDLAAAAFRSVEVADPFNMSSGEARGVGAVIGCDRFVMLRTGIQRRAATGGRFSFEAFAVTYLIDARTGMLARFDLASAEAASEADASARLLAKAAEIAAGIGGAKAPTQNASVMFPEPPPENSPEAAGLRLPIPYRRVRPEYTTLAALYGIKATVDIEVDIDAEGRIAASRVVRWAGFGLDEAVDAAVRSMNWRPAMRGGKSLPMRVLLRYNFRKVEADEEN